MRTATLLTSITRSVPLRLGLILCFLVPSMALASQWEIAEVDNTADVGKFASIAADGSNKLHISYFDATSLNLKYASDQSGGWLRESRGGYTFASGTGIAVDSSGLPRITYYYAKGGTKAIRTMAKDQGSWLGPVDIDSMTSIVESSTAVFIKDGISHVTYYKNQKLYYANNSGGSWSSGVAIDGTSGAGKYSDLVVDSGGKVHIIYYHVGTSDLLYITNATGAWQNTTLQSSADVGAYCSIAIDSGDNLHVSYQDTGAGKVKYLSKPVGGSWQAPVEIGDSGPLGGHTSIAVDTAGAPHISFYSSLTGRLNYATNAGGSWSLETVPDTAGDVGKYSSLAVDGNNAVSIAYYDVTSSSLKVATRKIPVIAAAPASIDFGSVNQGGQSPPQTITVTNNGKADLAIGQITKGGANPAEFIITGDSCSNSTVIPEAACTVQAVFAPVSGGAKTASLAIPSNDPYNPSLSATLAGTAPDTFSISASAGSGGSISPAGSVSVSSGASQTFTISPLAGFFVSDVLVDSTSIGAVTSYTFSNVTANHTIEAFFASYVRVSSVYFGTLQDAYNAAGEGAPIQARAVAFGESLICDMNKDVVFAGGYDSVFASRDGATILTGELGVSAGGVEVESLGLE